MNMNDLLQRAEKDELAHDDGALVRAENVTRTLMEKKLSDRTLYLSSGIEDAFFWGGIYEGASTLGTIPETDMPRLTVRFSWHGNLAAIWTTEERPPVAKDKVAIVKKTLEEHGFVWVDGDQLKRMTYTGTDEYFSGKSWWDRFFEYE